jgi:hypothetical protein
MAASFLRDCLLLPKKGEKDPAPSGRRWSRPSIGSAVNTSKPRRLLPHDQQFIVIIIILFHSSSPPKRAELDVLQYYCYLGTRGLREPTHADRLGSRSYPGRPLNSFSVHTPRTHQISLFPRLPLPVSYLQLHSSIGMLSLLNTRLTLSIAPSSAAPAYLH